MVITYPPRTAKNKPKEAQINVITVDPNSQVPSSSYTRIIFGAPTSSLCPYRTFLGFFSPHSPFSYAPPRKKTTKKTTPLYKTYLQRQHRRPSPDTSTLPLQTVTLVALSFSLRPDTSGNSLWRRPSFDSTKR